MGRFKSKKRYNNIIIYLGLFLLSVAFTIKYLYAKDLIQKNTLANILINDNLGNYKNDISDVDFLFKYALNIDLKEEKKENKNDAVNKEVNKEVNIDENTISNEPILYIYNTHQEEKYESAYLEAYNINTTVYMASKMLKEYLNVEGINSIVEDENVSFKLNSLGLKYGSSYKITRMFLENAKTKYPTLKYFIDLHRDSAKYENTTIKIDEISYARVLFVIGLENPNYSLNMHLVENIKNKLDEINPEIVRGVVEKSGEGVNGIYNQDFDPNVILIEVGGQYNNIEEVNNTLKLLAKVIKRQIEEDLNA